MIHVVQKCGNGAASAANRLLKSNNLDLMYDDTHGILWNFLSKDTTPYFSHEQLNDIRRVQIAISDGVELDVPHYKSDEVRYVVFGSRIPNVFSLGGDLELFRELIEKRDRTALQFYAKKATDAVYHHATNGRNIVTFSLVQGKAVGGGFEAALAGNVLVAERGTRMGFPEVLFGLFPGMGAYTLLRRRVDPITAERIITSAESYPAEELQQMGIVDILADPGDGERAVSSYIAKQRNRPGSAAFRKAINRVHGIDHRELYTMADEWVDAAMELPKEYLKRIDRLARNQRRNNVRQLFDEESPKEIPVVALSAT